MKSEQSLAFAITAIRRPVWGTQQESGDARTAHEEEGTS